MKQLCWPLLLFFCFGLISCATVKPPIEEYALARAALDAARVVEAARHSPGNWHQAEDAFRKGQALYEDRYYGEAKQEFIRARLAAERAENSARLIRMQTGEVL